MKRLRRTEGADESGRAQRATTSGPRASAGPKPDRGSAATEGRRRVGYGNGIYINKHHPHTSAPYFVGGASVWARASTTNACPIAMGSLVRPAAELWARHADGQSRKWHLSQPSG
nr:MAG TPA: Class II bacteriocin [Caudoviricetes sp.]